MVDIEAIKQYARSRRGFPLPRVPDDKYPEDRQPSDQFLAFSYESQEAADAYAEFLAEDFGHELVSEWTVAPGRTVHLYRLHSDVLRAKVEELRDEQASIMEAMRASRNPVVTDTPA